MNNLVPEQRVDKNGRLVTKHVRAGAKTVAGSQLPAPVLSTPAAKPEKKFSPTKKQQEQWYRSAVLPVEDINPDPRLMEALEGQIQPPSLHLRTNDVQAYEVLSILGPANGAAALHGRLHTADDVKHFLHHRGLEDLLVDDSDRAQEALQRRIPAPSYIEVMSVNSHRGYDDADLMDAAETRGMKSLRNFELHKDVAAGRISLEDIKTVGASRIGKYPYTGEDIGELLQELKKGTADFTADDLKWMVERAAKDRSDVKTIAGLATEFGTDFVRSLDETITALSFSISLHRIMGSADTKEKLEYARSAIGYHDRMNTERRRRIATVHDKETPFLSHQQAKEMHDAGLDIDEALDGFEQGLSVQQTRGIRDGITPSVSEGWL